MKEELYKHINVTLASPNDRCNLLLLEYLRQRSKKEEVRYKKLCCMYPDNEYFKSELVHELIELGLIQKEMTKDQYQDKTGQVHSGEFNPVTTLKGKEALKGLFPSEMEERNRMRHQYKINKGAFWIAVIGGISGFITTVINIYIQFC